MQSKFSCMLIKFILSSAIQFTVLGEEMYGHDIILDAHTVVFTEGLKSEIEDSENVWEQRFPFVHIDHSDYCEVFG